MVTETTTGTDTQVRTLSAIAREIKADWRPSKAVIAKGLKGGVYFGAVPYLDAMATMGKVTDSYGYDSGESVVLYFLANAQSWRGEVAKRVKAELKAMLKS